MKGKERKIMNIKSKITIFLAMITASVPLQLQAKQLYMKVIKTNKGVQVKIAATNVKVFKLGNSVVVDVFGQPSYVTPPHNRIVAGVRITTDDLRKTVTRSIRISITPPEPFKYTAKILGNTLIVNIEFLGNTLETTTNVHTINTSKKKRKNLTSSKSKNSSKSTQSFRNTSTRTASKTKSTQKSSSSVVIKNAKGERITVDIYGAQLEAVKNAFELATGETLSISGNCRIYIPSGEYTVDSLKKIIEDYYWTHCQSDTTTNK